MKATSIPSRKDFEQVKEIEGERYNFVDFSHNRTHLEKMIKYKEIDNPKIIRDKEKDIFVLYEN